MPEQNAPGSETTMRRILAIAVASVALLGPASHPRNPQPAARSGAASAADRALFSAVDSIAARALARGPIAGLSIAVVRGDSLIVSQGYGFADLEHRVPASEHTVYDIASVAKLLTAVAILRLADNGRVRLEDELGTLLPTFPNPEQGRRITVRHLLSHTSGLHDYEDADTERWLTHGTPLTESFVLEFLRARPLDFEPGTRWSYSNSGFYLLGLIVEQVTGKDYGRHLSEDVARPLGLVETVPCTGIRAPPHRSAGYEAAGDSLVPSRLYGLPGLIGDGGLCSTVADLARLPGALRRGGGVSEAAFAGMMQPITLSNGVVVDYGQGVRLGVLDGHALWGHTGGMQTYWSALVHYPETSTTIVVLVNTDGAAEDALTIEGDVARVVLRLARPVLRDEPLSRAEVGAFSGLYADGTGSIIVEDGGDGMRRVIPNDARPPRALRYQGEGVFGWSEYPLDRLRFHRVGDRAIGLSEYYNGIFATYRHAVRP